MVNHVSNQIHLTDERNENGNGIGIKAYYCQGILGGNSPNDVTGVSYDIISGENPVISRLKYWHTFDTCMSGQH